MGYTSLHLPKDKEKSELLWAISGSSYETLKLLKKGSTYFAAQKHIETGKIFALIILTERRNGEFFYKIMDETSGPYHTAKCPQSILKLLSPTENECALNWRKKQNDTPPNVKDGEYIKTNKKIHFTNDMDFDTFQKQGRRFYAQNAFGTKYRVSISRQKLWRLGEGFKIIG